MHSGKQVQLIELSNPLAEFTWERLIITRAALDDNHQPSGDLQVIAPVRLFVKAQAQQVAPHARRFLVTRGLMYQDTPEVIKDLLGALLVAARATEEQSYVQLRDQRV